ncbi:hypothetical protein ID866_7457 [Astraeus odoratus]|nr:hypothetical protein ID866_7457 [Astraeus odoratus]
MDLPHARKMTLDDIPTMNEIELYVVTELTIEHEIDEPEVEQLTQKCEGLFEWACLACRYIKTSVAGQMGKEWFDEVMSHESKEGNLLDGMYKAILEIAIGKKSIALKWFHSVMQQILSTFKLVPMHTLDAMQGVFPNKVDHYKVMVILQFMGTLLSGVIDGTKPICPLHASFYDFLTDASQSGDYFVGGESMDGNLASA